MNKWKKAISTLASASLLASLLMTVAATSALAFTAPCDATYLNGVYGTSYQYCTNVTERAANGTDYIVLSFQGTETATGSTLVQVSVTGGTFINGTSSFAPSSSVTYPRTSALVTGTAPVTLTSGSQLWLASSTAGTATVTVNYSTGVTVYDSVQAFTFTAASINVPSTALSTTSIYQAGVAVSSPASYPKAAATTTLTMHTVVKDNNGAVIPSGVTVEWTISGPAYFTASTTTGVGSATATATASATTGIADSPFIVSTGAGGTATVTTTVKYLGVSYALASKVINFVGDPTKITASVVYHSIATGQTQYGTDDGAIEVTVQDANGFNISTGVTFSTVSPTPAAFWTLSGSPSPSWSTVYTDWEVGVTCGDTAGANTAQIKATVGTKSVTTTDAVKITCASPLTDVDLGKLSVKAAATSVAPNGQLPLEVTVLDKNGLPAPEAPAAFAIRVTGVTNGVGTVVAASTGSNTKRVIDGVAKFIFLAPANAGSATVTFFVNGGGFTGGITTPVNASVTIAIGAVLVTGTNGSHLGLSHSGAFTAATKIQTRNHYVTWKLSFGAAAAGQSAAIWVATKKSDGTWGAFVKLTGRTIDSAGNAYFSWRSATVKWISVKGIAGSVGTPARQARWR